MAKKESQNTNSTSGGYQGANASRGSFGGTLIFMLVFAAIAGGALFMYSRHVGVDKAIDKIKIDAAELKRADDVVGLLEARKKYMEVSEQGRTIEDDERILTNMADIAARLYQAYGMNDMRDEAKRYIDKAKSIDSKKPARYAAEAYLLIGDGNPGGAEQVIRKLTDKGVREPRILHALSVAKLAQGKLKEAQTAAEEGQKLSTSLVRLPIAQGDAQVAQGKFNAARVSYSKALKLNKEHIHARAAILLAQAISGDSTSDLLHKGAAALTKLVAEMDPVPPRIQAFVKYTDGEVFLREGKVKEALSAADEALTIYAKLHEAHSLRGRALAETGKLDDAKAAFDAALAAVPTSLPYAKAGADVFARKGKAKWGIELLEKITASSADNGHAFVSLALAKAEGKDVAGTKAAADKAIELLGNNHEKALFAQGRAFQVANKLDDARNSYNEALKVSIDKKWPELFYQMGWVRFQEKSYDEAIQLFQESAKNFEQGSGTRARIADAMNGVAKSFAAKGGKKNQKIAAQWKERAAKVRRGS